MQFMVNNEFGYIPSSVFHTQTLLNPISDLFLFELVYHHSPERSFGSNQVVFGGIMFPVSAISINCFIETG